MTSPPETPSATEMPPDAFSATTAALLVVSFPMKLRVGTGGKGSPEDQTVRNPGPVGFTTVAFSKIACASSGIPQRFVSV
jgi:hypothetical protein